MRSELGMGVPEAVDRIASMLSAIDAPGLLMFVMCVDEKGCVHDSDCFVSQGGELLDIPMPALFGLAAETDSKEVVLVSRGDAEVPCPDAALMEFTRAVIRGGADLGIGVRDHHLVGSKARMSMAETTDLFDSGRT